MYVGIFIAFSVILNLVGTHSNSRLLLLSTTLHTRTNAQQFLLRKKYIFLTWNGKRKTRVFVVIFQRDEFLLFWLLLRKYLYYYDYYLREFTKAVGNICLFICLFHSFGASVTYFWFSIVIIFHGTLNALNILFSRDLFQRLWS